MAWRGKGKQPGWPQCPHGDTGRDDILLTPLPSPSPQFLTPWAHMCTEDMAPCGRMNANPMWPSTHSSVANKS